MRWLTNDESGAMAVVVAVMMGFFLVLVALVVDTGRLYDERRQLQNGADAAALAIAFDCARDESTCTATASARAGEWAGANAADSLSAIDPTSPLAQNPLVDFSAHTVTVDTRSQEPGQAAADGELPFIVEWPDGRTSQPVRARAVAEWGNLVGPAKTPPLTVSLCDFDTAVGYPAPPSFLPTGPVVITFHDPHGTGGTCDVHPGHDTVDGTGTLDGGFGALEPLPDDACAAKTVVTQDPATAEDLVWAIQGTGNAFKKILPCLLGKTQTPPEDILLPIFRDFCLGNKTCPAEIGTSDDAYLLDGYAMFRMTGWRHNSETSLNAPDCGATGTTCIAGSFVSAVVPTGQIGHGTYYGVRTAKLIR